MDVIALAVANRYAEKIASGFKEINVNSDNHLIIKSKDDIVFDAGEIKTIKGDKGDKGDTGSIKFIIVSELPTEDIDETAIYLLPTGDTQNAYDEYIYVDGVFEPLGQTQIEVDLSDYVKNTDYATNEKAGVIKSNLGFGTFMYDGILIGANKDYNDYSNAHVQTLISKGTLENVITGKGLVSNTDYATTTKAGVGRTSTTYGTIMGASGTTFAVANAQKSDIEQKKSNYKPIVPSTLDYSIKIGLTTNTETLTDEEKAKVQNWLGITDLIGSIETALQTLNNGEGVE